MDDYRISNSKAFKTLKLSDLKIKKQADFLIDRKLSLPLSLSLTPLLANITFLLEICFFLSVDDVIYKM